MTRGWTSLSPRGDADGPGGVALLVNVGNQLQRWSDDRWRSTKHRVTNPFPSTRGSGEKTRIRAASAFFHKANHVDADRPAFGELFPDRTTVGKKPARSKR